MRVLVDPTVAGHRSCYLAAAEALERRERGILLTTLQTPSTTTEQPSSSPAPPITTVEPADVQVEWLAEGSIAGRAAFPGVSELRSCLEHDRPRRFVAASPTPEGFVEVLVEPVIPRPLLLIAGGGHVGQALARVAVEIGFDVTVIDDRPEFIDPALFPSTARTCCGPVAELIASQPMGDSTYVVIVTRGHRHDADALRACIHGRPAYIGMINQNWDVSARFLHHFTQAGNRDV